MNPYVKTFFAFFSFLFPCLPFQACKDDDCPEDENAVIESFAFPSTNAQSAWLQNVDPNQTPVNLVITSVEDYEKFVATSNNILRPSIDFSQFTLLAGRTITPECAFVESQSVLNKCGACTFEVTLQAQDCHAITPNHYFVLIRNTDKPIQFQIKTQE